MHLVFDYQYKDGGVWAVSSSYAAPADALKATVTAFSLAGKPLFAPLTAPVAAVADAAVQVLRLPDFATFSKHDPFLLRLSLTNAATGEVVDVNDMMLPAELDVLDWEGSNFYVRCLCCLLRLSFCGFFQPWRIVVCGHSARQCQSLRT